MDKCEQLINMGRNIRYVTTIVVFYLLGKKNKYLILPIVLTVLDSLDTLPLLVYNQIKCTHLFYYQVNDKICDSISYLLLFLFFKLDNLVFFFALYRIIGVILFRITKDSRWLILFFDFVKECLLYLFIFGKKDSYIFIFILFKIGVEYYFHTILNKNNYKEKKKKRIKTKTQGYDTLY